MCLFMQNFSATEFNSFPSAQQCLCGLEARTQPLAFFHKIERQLLRGRGTLDVGREGAAVRKERDQCLEAKGDMRGSRAPGSVEVREGKSCGSCWPRPHWGCEGGIQRVEG